MTYAERRHVLSEQPTVSPTRCKVGLAWMDVENDPDEGAALLSLIEDPNVPARVLTEIITAESGRKAEQSGVWRHRHRACGCSEGNGLPTPHTSVA